MKLIINREVILGPLQGISSVIERRHSLPILANTLMTAEENVLALGATDMEVELLIRIDHPVQKGGSTTLPARKFLDICRSLAPEAEIQIEQSGDHVTIRSGRSRFNLSTLPPSDYPAMGELDSTFACKLPATELKRVIDDTQFAMAHQDVRYYLNGLLLEISKGFLRAVATDGHRLAISDAKLEIEPPEGSQSFQVIVPRKGVIEIARLLSGREEEVELAIGTGHITIQTLGQRLTSKLIDGRFPDYERVIPKGMDKTVRANRDSLRQGLSRTSILSTEKYKGIRIILEPNVLRAFAHNPEHEEAEEEIEVEYAGPGMEIGFNVSYLLDAIDAIRSEFINIEFSDPGSSCLITPISEESRRYVVMPMRL